MAEYALALVWDFPRRLPSCRSNGTALDIQRFGSGQPSGVRRPALREKGKQVVAPLRSAEPRRGYPRSARCCLKTPDHGLSQSAFVPLSTESFIVDLDQTG
jgi:hypothetical protein